MKNRSGLKDLFKFEEELYKEEAPKIVEQSNSTFFIDDLELLDEEVSLGQVRQRSTERAGIAYEG